MSEAAPSVEHAEPTLRLRGRPAVRRLLAVNEVDLDVVHGERRAILGPNGAGRRPSSTSSAATFRVDGNGGSSARTSRSNRRATGRRSDSRAPISSRVSSTGSPSRTPSVDRGRRGWSPASDPAPRQGGRSGSALRRRRQVAISNKLDEVVGSLSHGEHRQVAIAMALAAQPKALMLDEPASGSRAASASCSPSSCSGSIATSR